MAPFRWRARRGRVWPSRPTAPSTPSAPSVWPDDNTRSATTSPAAASPTLYLGGEQLVVNSGSSTVHGTRYYPTTAGGPTIIRTSDGQLVYELANAQNTSSLTITADSAQTETRRHFTPYGAPRGTTPPSWVDNRQFLNQPSDPATGLGLLGARNYDPTTGRFLQIDPVLEATDPNQLSGYTYAGNNPIAHSDPSGLCIPEFCNPNLDPLTDPGSGGTPKKHPTDKGGCGSTNACDHHPNGHTHSPSGRDSEAGDSSGENTPQAASSPAAAPTPQPTCTPFVAPRLGMCVDDDTPYFGHCDKKMDEGCHVIQDVVQIIFAKVSIMFPVEGAVEGAAGREAVSAGAEPR